VLIFDEATSSLDQQTAERFTQTVNRLKGMASVLFVAHQLPRGLSLDELFTLTPDKATQMRVVDEEKSS
jgi:subfamily B ATP-binding cassette protein HlyB/CyaB